ncbi:S24 family peptidase [Vibrio artabrorum]
MKRICDIIRTERKKLKVTQRELAKVAKVTPAAVSQWERDETLPKGKSLILLAKYFGMPVERLSDSSDSSDLNLPQDNSLLVDFYPDVYASGGCGSFVNSEISEKIYIPILNLDKANKQNLKCIKVSGDSMSPTLIDNSIIVLDISQKLIKDGAIYVFTHGDLLRVKELRNQKGGNVLIVSHNNDYENENAELKEISIIGKVIQYSSSI